MTRRQRHMGVCVLTLVATIGACRAPAHRSVSDPEREAALTAAHQMQSRISGTFLVATYRPDDGEHGPSNTGHSCVSGHTVLVRLLWARDGGFVHSGPAGGGPPDGPHKALLVTADATAGTPCLISAEYADDDPEPGEIYLYGPREDLVSPS